MNANTIGNDMVTPEQADILIGIRNRILAIVATLVGFGMVLIYSASMVKAGNDGWEMQYLANQFQWLLIGSAGMAVISLIDYRVFRKLAPVIFLVTLALLAAVRVPGVGTKVRGAYRWLRIGGFNMQPSELAKVALVIVVAALLSRCRGGRPRFFRDVIPVVGVIAAGAGLIVIEPDFGTAALTAVVLFAMLVVGGARWYHIMPIIVAGIPPVAFYGWTRFSHIEQRVLAWLSGDHTGAGMQPWMSKMAIGSGGLYGMGTGHGTSKLYFLPDAHTDFIFAVAGQEFGLVGGVIIITLFALFVREGMRLVRYAPNRFGALLAFGVVMMIGLQAAFNLAVVTGSVPPKGISLPFVSSGGSGLCVALSAVGLLISVSRRVTVREDVVEEVDAFRYDSGDEPSGREAA